MKNLRHYTLAALLIFSFFGIVLGAYRKPDMTVDLNRKLPPLLHHDVDAPPYWNVRKKRSLYADGFAPKTARPLMQFIMLPRVTPEQLTEWEPEFADILSWIESVESRPATVDQRPWHVQSYWRKRNRRAGFSMASQAQIPAALTPKA